MLHDGNPIHLNKGDLFTFYENEPSGEVSELQGFYVSEGWDLK